MNNYKVNLDFNCYIDDTIDARILLDSMLKNYCEDLYQNVTISIINKTDLRNVLFSATFEENYQYNKKMFSYFIEDLMIMDESELIKLSNVTNHNGV